MEKDSLRFRQIHLDFHTSPNISGIGEKFDKKQYQDVLKRGHVNSITTFALCHHGWHYHETKVGEMHPHLEFDLLRAQYEACREIDINVPIYLTAGINDRVVDLHPEWRAIDTNGSYIGANPDNLNPGFKKLCFNTPYLDLLCEQIIETAQLFPDCHGIFLDIISQPPCCCNWCLKSMIKQDFNPVIESERKAHARTVQMKYYQQTTAALRSVSSEMPIFHNSGHITRGAHDILPYFSHMELESLPTGGWGYDHFPTSAKYVKNLDFDVLGMTGKFHSAWGEFGGFKHPNALRYECAAMLAYGARCSVGDQLHPNGKINETTYDIIGTAFSEVEQKEPWCVGTENVADIALLSCEALQGPSGDHGADNVPDTGASRALLEEQFLFNIIDDTMDFSAYKVLVLPDSITIDADLKAKLDAYLANGGKLFLTGDSGLNPDKTEFVFDIGADYEGASPFEPDYIYPNDDIRPDFINSPLVMYKRPNRIKATTGESLGQVFDSFFNRTWDHYCSHQHTPNVNDASGYDCGVMNGNILYLAHPVFSCYFYNGAVAYRHYAAAAIRKLLADDQSLTLSNMPSTSRISMMKQAKENRDVLHLLYANTVNRGGGVIYPDQQPKQVEIIEELMPLYNIGVELQIEKEVKAVTLEPQGHAVEFVKNGNSISCTVPEFTCHQMLVIQY
jgi:Hypothetical glycosyl hydrolase 6/Beta-galactosidase trimerisation domain